MRYFKVIQPEVNEEFQYIINLKSNEDGHFIGYHKLDIRRNSDALTLFGICKFDDKSIIEFYGKQFIVKNWSINHRTKQIEIWI